MVPRGNGFGVLPSTQLVHHLARRALEVLPRGRRGPLLSRLIHNPAGIVRKGLAAWRLLRHDRGARRMLTAYRRQPRLRQAVGVHALLDDLLRLDLLRAARHGTLRTCQAFAVSWDYDPAAAALVAVSRRGPGPAGPDGLAAGIDALGQGRIQALVWDHAAVASQVVCRVGRSGWLTYTLGPGGVYRFRALERLYAADAREVGGALVSMLAARERPAEEPAT